MKKFIHKTPCEETSYCLVEIIKNPISPKNKLAEIKLPNGEVKMTGAILVETHPKTIEILDTMEPTEQYEWLKSIRHPHIYI